MKCCDCGLMHQVEFNAIKIHQRLEDSTFEYDQLDSETYRVEMRLRRLTAPSNQQEG
jgi:hypothetical protein